MLDALLPFPEDRDRNGARAVRIPGEISHVGWNFERNIFISIIEGGIFDREKVVKNCSRGEISIFLFSVSPSLLIEKFNVVK